MRNNIVGYGLFLDYDKKRLRDVEREVRYLKKLYPFIGKAIIKLSSIRRRRRNYHVAFPEANLRSQEQVVEILSHTSCDPKFIACANSLTLSVIRLFPSKYKPEIKVVKVIE